MQVVFASAEVAPFARTGGLGDVCGALPKSLAALGHDVIVVTPFYRQTRAWFQARGLEPEHLANLMVILPDWSAPLTLLRATLPGSDVAVVFVVNDAFFDRPDLYSNRDDGFDDQIERFTFFCHAVVAACEFLELRPDIIHAHDWHTALLPIYLATDLRSSPLFEGTRSFFTIHNLNYQGRYGADRFPSLGLQAWLWSPTAVEYFGDVNLMKGAIIFSDVVTTVSPTYAREIQSPAHGAGLDGILRENAHKLAGILNGIDVDEWDPTTDPALDAHYDASSLQGKSICKRALRREAGLAAPPRAPIAGIVSRLVDQKGFDLLLPVIPRILSLGAQIVLLGTGEPFYEEMFRRLQREYPKQLHAWITFDPALAHRITAGSDFILMPSIYEPCGLNQMYALRYGTLPIVRLTGGLADTVTPYDGSNRDEANGFGFAATDPQQLFMTSWIAALVWRDEPVRRQLQANGMAADFSWEASARRYDELYRGSS